MKAKQSKKISAFVKASLGLLLTATVDFLVAYSTAHWATWSAPSQHRYGGYGLWKLWRCSVDPERHLDTRHVVSSRGFGFSDQVLREEMGCEVKLSDSSFPVWYVSSQVLQTLGLAALVTSIILVFVYMFVPKWTADSGFLKCIITVTYTAGIFMAVSLFVFGFKVAEEIAEMKVKDWALSWSFSLSCTACFLVQIAASVLVSDSKRTASGDVHDETLPTASTEYDIDKDECSLFSEAHVPLSRVVSSA